MYDVMLSRLKYYRLLFILNAVCFVFFVCGFVGCMVFPRLHVFIECGYLAGCLVSIPIGYMFKELKEDCSKQAGEVLRSDVRGMLFFVYSENERLPISVASLLPVSLKGFWLEESVDVFERLKELSEEDLRFARDAMILYMFRHDGVWNRRPYVERYMLE